MAQDPNQLVQGPVKGSLDMRMNTSVMACQINSTSAGGLVPGQAVKMVDSAGGIPKIVECAANDDDVFGFIVFDLKSSSYGVGDVVEVAYGRGSVMYMEAASAVGRNVQVGIVISGSKVDDVLSTKRIIGRALDKALAAGDLIRVIIDLPGTLAP